MKHKCPICSKTFDTLDSFDTHIENHKKDSVLNETPRTPSDDTRINNKIHPANLEKFFDEEKFQELVDEKINSIENLDELIYRQNFVSILKDVYRKNPFCYLPYFLDSFMSGIPAKKIISTFHFSNSISYYDIVKEILGLKQKRFEKQYYSNALELNLKISGWSEIFESIKENSEFFEDELNELYFNSVIQAQLFLLLIIHNDFISKNELITFCNYLKDNFGTFRFIDDSLAKKFEKYFGYEFEKKIDDILSDFLSKQFVRVTGDNEKKFKGTLSIDDIKSTIRRTLKIHDKKLRFGRLKTLISQEHPGLYLVPGLEIFENTLFEMEEQNELNLEVKSNWRDDYYVFLNDEFQKISSNMKSIDAQDIGFKGRKISPDQFVSELLELEKGDFDDGDDQVTRIAGLVLAESVSLEAPRENIPEFDFSINLKNYHFREEQLEAMNKLNFKIMSEIFHIKVMIDEKLTLKKYNELLEKVPPNEQAVIVTFQKSAKNVQSILDSEPKIQVIDEEGIKIWVSITSNLPARTNSICKISFDPLSKIEKKLVKVNSVFYEKGLAIVTLIPEMTEATVLVKTLEEISFLDDSLLNFDKLSEIYFQLMISLTKLSYSDEFTKGIFESDVEIADLSVGLWNAKSSNQYVKISLNEFLSTRNCNCNCLGFNDNPRKFCRHIISVFDYVARHETRLLGSSFSDDNIFYEIIMKFIAHTTFDEIDELSESLDKDFPELFKKYLIHQTKQS